MTKRGLTVPPIRCEWADNITFQRQNSRVTSSLCLFCGLGLAQVVGNPALGTSVKLLELCRGVVFWRVVHLDPVDQIFLDPVVAPVGILLVDARDGLIEIEPFAIGPDKKTLPGVELN